MMATEYQTVGELSVPVTASAASRRDVEVYCRSHPGWARDVRGIDRSARFWLLLRLARYDMAKRGLGPTVAEDA